MEPIDIMFYELLLCIIEQGYTEQHYSKELISAELLLDVATFSIIKTFK